MFCPVIGIDLRLVNGRPVWRAGRVIRNLLSIVRVIVEDDLGRRTAHYSNRHRISSARAVYPGVYYVTLRYFVFKKLQSGRSRSPAAPSNILANIEFVLLVVSTHSSECYCYRALSCTRVISDMNFVLLSAVPWSPGRTGAPLRFF